jgi:hypothetical protein
MVQGFEVCGLRIGHNAVTVAIYAWPMSLIISQFLGTDGDGTGTFQRCPEPLGKFCRCGEVATR